MAYDHKFSDSNVDDIKMLYRKPIFREMFLTDRVKEAQ